MPLRFRGRRKRDWRFFAQRRIRRHFARVFLPFFDLGRIGDDLNLTLVIAETHSPAEALLVQIAEPALIIMMTGRAEKCSAQSAAGDVGEISFDRLRLDDVDLVKIILGKTKRVPLEKLPIDRDRAVFAELKKRRRCWRGQLNVMTGRFLQKKPSKGKQRIRERAGFDLSDDIFESRHARQKFDRDWRQRAVRGASRTDIGLAINRSLPIFPMSILRARRAPIMPTWSVARFSF